MCKTFEAVIHQYFVKAIRLREETLNIEKLLVSFKILLLIFFARFLKEEKFEESCKLIIYIFKNFPEVIFNYVQRRVYVPCQLYN